MVRLRFYHHQIHLTTDSISTIYSQFLSAVLYWMQQIVLIRLWQQTVLSGTVTMTLKNCS